MARRTKEDTEKTYHAILDAATVLFTEQGVGKTTLNEIATAAGMTRGAIYWHFENKDAVIKALWERSASHRHAETIHSLCHLPNSYSLDAFIHTVQSMLQEAFRDPKLNQALRIIFSSMEFTQNASELQHFLRQKRDSLYGALESAVNTLKAQRLLKEELSVNLITNGLWAFITGVLRTQFEIDNNTMEIASQSDVLIEHWILSMATPT